MGNPFRKVRAGSEGWGLRVLLGGGYTDGVEKRDGYMGR